MTAPPATTVPPATTASPTPRALWRAARAPLLVVGLLVLTALVVTLATAPGSSERLDPASAAPEGSRALATLLAQQGVEVVSTTDATRAAAAGRGTTVLVVHPDRLEAATLRSVTSAGADVVLLAPTEASVDAVAGLRQVGSIPAGTLAAPHCALPAATRAGAAEVGGHLYAADGRPGCYPHGAGASLVVVATGDRQVSVLGDPTPLTNAHLAEQGNAALALGLLGQHDRLLWLIPAAGAVAAADSQAIGQLVPAGVRLGLVQLALTVVLLALWRGRRLGPVVVEALPVVVRASETVEGRARLYRRTHARDRAAGALRGATRSRLARALALPAGGDPAGLVAAVAAHTARTAGEVSEMLYGAAPTDDRALVALANALDALEKEVRRS